MCVFSEELQVICQTLKHNPTFICGDFNIDLFKYESHQTSKDFVNQLFSSGYYPLIDLLTRINGNISTLIDNIYMLMLLIWIQEMVLLLLLTIFLTTYLFTIFLVIIHIRYILVINYRYLLIEMLNC